MTSALIVSKQLPQPFILAPIGLWTFPFPPNFRQKKCFTGIEGSSKHLEKRHVWHWSYRCSHVFVLSFQESFSHIVLVWASTSCLRCSDLRSKMQAASWQYHEYRFAGLTVARHTALVVCRKLICTFTVYLCMYNIVYIYIYYEYR